MSAGGVASPATPCGQRGDIGDTRSRCGVKLTFEWVGKDKLRAEAERDTPNGID